MQEIFRRHKWEETVVLDFDPAAVGQRTIRYVKYKGEETNLKNQCGICPAEQVVLNYVNGCAPNLSDLKFPDPNHFVSLKVPSGLGVNAAKISR